MNIMLLIKRSESLINEARDKREGKGKVRRAEDEEAEHCSRQRNAEIPISIGAVTFSHSLFARLIPRLTAVSSPWTAVLGNAASISVSRNASPRLTLRYGPVRRSCLSGRRQ